MDTPQDLIKPVPPSPSGKTSSRGPADIGRSGDGGAEFAEAMRSARESSRPEVRETQAPDRKQREIPEDGSEEPVYASKDKGSATEAAGTTAPQTGTPESTQAASGMQGQPPADAASQQPIQVAVASAQTLAMPVPVANGATPVNVAATANTPSIQPLTQPSLATTAPVSDTPINSGLSGVAERVDATATAAATSLATGTAARFDAAAISANVQPVPATMPPLETQAVPAGDTATAAFNAGLQGNARPLPTGTTPQAPASGQSAGIAPSTVALAVDRAIGNAIVNRPATGTFKPADLATQAPVDPARIANTGFVAVALQPSLPKDPATEISPMGEALAATDTPEMSGWLAVRPDSLAMALAERTLSQEGTLQLPAKLDQALQSLDSQLLGMSAGSAMPALTGQADAGEPLGAIAAMVDAQNNQAVSVQAAGMPADNAEPVSLSLNAPLQQSNRWAAEFGDRLAWVANNRFNSATLQINPPQLGPIEVRIQLSGDQAAVSFAAVQPQTREAIQQALPVLASSLMAQGLSLGQTSVGRDHLPQQGDQGRSGGNSSGQPSLITTAANTPVAGTAAGVTRGGNGLVDTFV